MPKNLTLEKTLSTAAPTAKMQSTLQGLTSALRGVGTAGSQTKRVLADLRTGLQKTAAQVKRSLAAFDEINRLQSGGTAAKKGGSRAKTNKTAKADPAETLTPWQQALQQLRAQWDGFYAHIRSLLAPLGTAWDILCRSFAESWQVYAPGITAGLATALQGVKTLLQTLWDETFQPFLQNCAGLLATLWQQHLQPLWQQLALTLGALATLLLNLWNTVLAPLLQWAAVTFGPGVSLVFSGLATAAAGFVGVVADCINIALTVLQGLADFVSGVLTGQWDAAWNAMATMVGAVWQKIVAMVQNAASAAVNAVKSMFDGLWSIVQNILSAIGGVAGRVGAVFKGGGAAVQPFAALPALPVPALAGGAVIPANRRFLAMLGDQTSGTNVEAPLDTIKQAVAEVLNGFAGGGEQPINIYIGEELLDTVIAGSQRRRAVRSGGR